MCGRYLGHGGGACVPPSDFHGFVAWAQGVAHLGWASRDFGREGAIGRETTLSFQFTRVHRTLYCLWTGNWTCDWSRFLTWTESASCACVVCVLEQACAFSRTLPIATRGLLGVGRGIGLAS